MDIPSVKVSGNLAQGLPDSSSGEILKQDKTLDTVTNSKFKAKYRPGQILLVNEDSRPQNISGIPAAITKRNVGIWNRFVGL